jgi:hypothetical protein
MTFSSPPIITLLCCVIRGVVGNYVFDVDFPLEENPRIQGLVEYYKLSLSSQFFNFPLKVCQSST